MARVPPIKRLVREDFKDQKDWIDKLIQPINQFFESVTTGLSKGLTLSDNVDAQIQTVNFTEGDAPSFRVTTKGRPRGVVVTGIYNFTTPADPVTGAVFPIWEYNATDNSIKLTKIYGLKTGEKYSLTLLIHTT